MWGQHKRADNRQASGRAGAELKALQFALATVLLWSTVATAFKLGLQRLEPLQLLLAATTVSTALYWIMASYQRRWRLSGRQLARALATGLINPFAYYIVLFEAYDRLPAQVAQPVNYSWAITLALLAWPVLGQRPGLRRIGAMLASYAGVLIVIGPGDLDGGPLNKTGLALALISTLLWAGYWLANARMAQSASARSAAEPVAFMAWSFLFGLAAILLTCMLGPGMPAVDGHTLAFGAWVGLAEMGLAFLFWRRAMALTAHTARIGQLVYLSPVLSLGMIAWVLGEPLRPATGVGLAIIIAGLIAAQPGTARRRPARK